MSVAAVPLGSALTVPSDPARERPLRIETIEDVAAFTALKGEWTALLEAAPAASAGFFLTWEWLHTWWTHLAGGRRLSLLTVRRGAELVAIAPFLTNAGVLLARRGFLGTGRVGSDYLDIVVRPGAEDGVVRHIAAHLARHPAVLDLQQLDAAAAARGLVEELRRSGGLVQTRPTHVCPFIDLRGSNWDSYLGSLGSEHRYNFHRRLRKLETQHALRFERVTSEAKRRQVLPILLELHRRRWSERGGSDGLAGEGIIAFHEELSRLALERGWLRLFVLWLGAAPAAALYGFRYRGVFHFYQSGFDPKYRKLSVGLVTMGLAIKSAIEERTSTFDLLHGEEAYKSHWAKQARPLERVLVFPSGFRGRLAWSAATAAEATRGLKRRLWRGDAASRR